MTLVYVLPTFYNCGGNRIACEHVGRLKARGHDVAITAVDPYIYDFDWFDREIPVVPFGMLKHGAADAVVATYYETYYSLRSLGLGPEVKKFYLVQQIESRFREDEAGKTRADATYKDSSYEIITIARWLKVALKERFGRDVFYVPNKQELPDFGLAPMMKHATDKPVVLIEGNATCQSKGVIEAIDALSLVGVPHERWLLSNDMSWVHPKIFGFFEQKFIGVPWKESLNVIRSADILVKASHFEGSPTVHQEAWGQGTVVVTTDCTGVEEYGIDGYNCLKVPVGDVRGIADRVSRLLVDKELMFKLQLGGFETAKQFDKWGPAIDQLEEIFGFKRE